MFSVSRRVSRKNISLDHLDPTRKIQLWPSCSARGWKTWRGRFGRDVCNWASSPLRSDPDREIAHFLDYRNTKTQLRPYLL